MNAYLFSSIQSAAYGNLFECSTHEEKGSDIVFSSMSHENEVGVMDDGEDVKYDRINTDMHAFVISYRQPLPSDNSGVVNY